MTKMSLLKMPLPVMAWWNVGNQMTVQRAQPSFFEIGYFSIKRLYIDMP